MDLVPTIPISSTLVPRKNGKVVKQLDQFMYLGESFKAILKEHDFDPTYYDEAMSNMDAHLWQKAMEAKLESMNSNQARLVAKGYSQKPSFDYDETFVLVAMLKSNRILLSIVAHLDYEIWKMDVKTRFLNDNLDESIYMM
ncbi:Copia protein [Vitis vinifera]|uniref:Copia protein n=1 Tax=Vitis vinifera TaxID=29760 RepID=A0A438JQT3_VITVI|nr:Copia protein [Vitis vinifera]